MEKGCKWYFGPEGGVDNGPTSPSKGTFKSLPDINIVREAIQNSLDVPADPASPVEVVFSFTTLKYYDFPNFFHIREHIKASLDFYPDNDRAREKFPKMIDLLSKSKGSKEYAEEIGILTVSDFNTKGMTYVPGDRKCSFYAFFRSIGVSTGKGQGAGGSNGLGKETLYQRSEIKTLLLSSRNESGEVVFQGSSKLTTHIDPDVPNRKVTAFGYYGQSANDPITCEKDIPLQFVREKTGTDIHIVGVDLSKKEETRDNIIRAVLNHFWLAIYRKRLVVTVHGERIDDRNLGEVMSRFFKSEGNYEAAALDAYESWNPQPYYQCVIDSVAGKEKTVVEEGVLENLGHVLMYLDWSKPDLPRHIAYMRQPRMVIYKSARRKLPPFIAVFVCDNDDGNKALRCTEPPAHDAWRIDNYEGEENREKYAACIVEVGDFVDKTIRKYLKPKTDSRILRIPGLAELLPDENDEEIGGEPGAGGSTDADGVKPTGDGTDAETGGRSTFIDDGSGVTVQLIPEGATSGDSRAVGVDSDSGDDEDAARGGDGAHGDGDNTGGGGGGHGEEDDPNGLDKEHVGVSGPGEATIRIKLAVNVVGHRRDGILWHYVVLRPSEKYLKMGLKNIKFHLQSLGDTGSEDLEILKVEGDCVKDSSVHGDTISNVAPLSAEMKFDVLFSDSIQHRVKVTADANK